MIFLHKSNSSKYKKYFLSNMFLFLNFFKLINIEHPVTHSTFISFSGILSKYFFLKFSFFFGSKKPAGIKILSLEY